MRGIGWLHPSEQASVPADTQNCLLLAAATAAALAVPAGAGMVRLSGLTTAGALLSFYVNFLSSAAQAPTSSVTAGSSGSTDLNVPFVNGGGGYYQLPGGTAGSSVIGIFSPTSGIVVAEWWKRI